MGKNHGTNTLAVTQDVAHLQGTWLRAGSVNWLNSPQLPLRCCAKIRYRQDDQGCLVSQAADGKLLVRFDAPQRAITPGQHVAFYDDDRLLGGATIQTTGTPRK